MDILSLLVTIYACRKDLAKHTAIFYDSKIGKYILKIIVLIGLVFFIYIDVLIFVMTLLKHSFSLNAFHCSFAIFITLLTIILGYFYFNFKELFFSKNKNNQKPFSIV